MSNIIDYADDGDRVKLVIVRSAIRFEALSQGFSPEEAFGKDRIHDGDTRRSLIVRGIERSACENGHPRSAKIFGRDVGYEREWQVPSANSWYSFIGDRSVTCAIERQGSGQSRNFHAWQRIEPKKELICKIQAPLFGPGCVRSSFKRRHSSLKMSSGDKHIARIKEPLSNRRNSG